MQLVLDVGNTETVVGVVDGASDLKGHWRISTKVPRTSDEYGYLLRGLLREAGFDRESLTRAVVGSVVPSATDVLRPTLEGLVDGPVFVVDPGVSLPVRLDVDEPRTVGADRIVNTLAAREFYHRDTVVVDLGTATTYDCITAEGVFEGGVIAPGVSAGLEWLAARTAKLPAVEFSPPVRVVGRRTETCIQSGIFYGVVDALDGMVDRIRQEWGRPEALVVATGGFAPLVGPHCRTVERVEPWLTLYGLAVAGRLLAGE
ncbi:MAG: type III pantothenate kinase [Gemmatimonadales bacterium]|jgi:type III pantothenate kinase|nr:MAG: type III pantothenate kinase [Gemmatimonadales bacterium]